MQNRSRGGIGDNRRYLGGAHDIDVGRNTVNGHLNAGQRCGKSRVHRRTAREVRSVYRNELAGRNPHCKKSGTRGVNDPVRVNEYSGTAETRALESNVDTQVRIFAEADSDRSSRAEYVVLKSAGIVVRTVGIERI